MRLTQKEIENLENMCAFEKERLLYFIVGAVNVGVENCDTSAKVILEEIRTRVKEGN